jgi:hypothetical protein
MLLWFKNITIYFCRLRRMKFAMVWSFIQRVLPLLLCCPVMNEAILWCDPLSRESCLFACVVLWWMRPFCDVILYPESPASFPVLSCDEWGHSVMWSFIQRVLLLCLCCPVMTESTLWYDPLSRESSLFSRVVLWWMRPFCDMIVYPESPIFLPVLPCNEWSLALVLCFIHITLPLYFSFLWRTRTWNDLIPSESLNCLSSCGETALSMVWSFVQRALELCLACHMASQSSKWFTSSSRASYNFYKRVSRKDPGPNSEQDPNSFNGQFE